MEAYLAYLIPVVGCLLAAYGFGAAMPPGVWVLCCALGEIVIALLHRQMMAGRKTSQEMLGGYIMALYYEEDWVELRTYYVTHYDSNGRPYEVEETQEIYHPEEFRFLSSLGDTVDCTPQFWNWVRCQWNATEHEVEWEGSSIQGYTRSGLEIYVQDARDNKFIPYTQLHNYVNRVKHSTSLFRSERLTDEDTVGLFERPCLWNGYDIPCLLSRDYPIDNDTVWHYEIFNAVLAPSVEMRLIVLVFPARLGIDTVRRQRAYWQGGEKNEFTVCIGVADDVEVQWAEAFSWTDRRDLEVMVSRYFKEHPQLDLEAFLHWFKQHFTVWQRKPFSDFSYIRLSLATSEMIWLYAAALLATAGLLILFCFYVYPQHRSSDKHENVVILQNAGAQDKDDEPYYQEYTDEPSDAWSYIESISHRERNHRYDSRYNDERDYGWTEGDPEYGEYYDPNESDPWADPDDDDDDDDDDEE